MIIPFARRPIPRTVVLAAAIAWAVGTVAAIHVHRLGLTLSHYDARGHLIVARRIVDSITPGWQQVGAVWLPLPLLINALPVQIDVLYRTGASAVAISVAAFAVSAGAIASIVLSVTASEAAALAAATVFTLNPNVLYLQSTPMTEPLLVALTTSAVAMLIAWSRRSDGFQRSHDKGTGRVGAMFALACLTRYEAWPVTAVALALTVWTLRRRGQALREAVRDVGTIAIYPSIAIVGFAIFSRVVIGQWFVAGDFFVPENKALGDIVLAAKEIGWGTEMLSSGPVLWLGVAGLAALVVLGGRHATRSVISRPDADSLAVLALTATALIPLAAFYRGHPFRIRYMVPLVAIEAIGVGLLAGLFRRLQIPMAIVLTAIGVATLHPFESAPMIVEAQWDRPNEPVRARVLSCVGQLKPGAKIMASMGSLGHFMQEASAFGFQLRDFLHEGNGDIWLAAIERPRPFADWLMIEEKAEGGDMLARISREHPHFLDGYSRVCEGAGLALYKRD